MLCRKPRGNDGNRDCRPLLWTADAEFVHPPGEKQDFTLSRSYGCGIPSGSANLIVYRSAAFGYVDLQRGKGTENFGGIRPGCWINALPAGGLVLMPDATDRCTCSYLMKASIALAPRGSQPAGH